LGVSDGGFGGRMQQTYFGFVVLTSLLLVALFCMDAGT